MQKVSYVVDLSDKERVKLLNIVNKGKATAKRILHANILLAADINNPNKASSPVIAERFHVHRQTVQTVRKTYATQGLEATLDRKKRTKSHIDPKLTGDVEARIIAICCSNPPPGFERWTLRLVAEEAVKLEIVPTISHTSVGRILKKRISTSPEEVLVHSTGSKCSVCRLHGGRSGGIYSPFQSIYSSHLHG